MPRASRSRHRRKYALLPIRYVLKRGPLGWWLRAALSTTGTRIKGRRKRSMVRRQARSAAPAHQNGEGAPRPDQTSKWHYNIARTEQRDRSSSARKPNSSHPTAVAALQVDQQATGQAAAQVPPARDVQALPKQIQHSDIHTWPASGAHLSAATAKQVNHSRQTNKQKARREAHRLLQQYDYARMQQNLYAEQMQQHAVQQHSQLQSQQPQPVQAISVEQCRQQQHVRGSQWQPLLQRTLRGGHILQEQQQLQQCETQQQEYCAQIAPQKQQLQPSAQQATAAAGSASGPAAAACQAAAAAVPAVAGDTAAAGVSRSPACSATSAVNSTDSDHSTAVLAAAAVVASRPAAAVAAGESVDASADSNSDVVVIDDSDDDVPEAQDSPAPAAAGSSSTPPQHHQQQQHHAPPSQQHHAMTAAELAAALAAPVSAAVLDPRPCSLATAMNSTWNQLLQQVAGKQCVAKLVCGPQILEILRSDWSRLRGSQWLNDEVINFYLSLVQVRSNTIIRQQQALQAAVQHQRQQQQQEQDVDGDLIRQLANTSLQESQDSCQQQELFQLQQQQHDIQYSHGQPSNHQRHQHHHCHQQHIASSSQHQQQHHVQLSPEQHKLLSVPTSYTFSSFFYQLLANSGPRRQYDYSAVRRWTLPNKTRTQECVLLRDLLLFPINLSNTHWAVAAVWPKRGVLQYYDSMNGTGSSILANLARWLVDDAADKGIILPHLQRVRLEAVRAGMPQQADGNSCGVFACTVCERLAAGHTTPFQFSQADVAKLRLGMAADILRVSVQ